MTVEVTGDVVTMEVSEPLTPIANDFLSGDNMRDYTADEMWAEYSNCDALLRKE